MSGKIVLQSLGKKQKVREMAGYQLIEIEVTQKLYNSLQSIAKSYGQDVKELIEDRLEELYG
jgi:hypothetical protein